VFRFTAKQGITFRLDKDRQDIYPGYCERKLFDNRFEWEWFIFFPVRDFDINGVESSSGA
jgi:hypothetical protein